MRRHLKKFGIAALLLVAKSFVYMRQLLQRLPASRLGAALRTAGQFLLRGLVVIVALPGYHLTRRLHNDCRRVFTAGHSYLLRSVSHRYILHLAILTLALLTAYDNLITQPAGAAALGQQASLIFSIVGANNEDLSPSLPTIDTSTPDQETPSSTETAQPQALGRTFLSYSGEAVFQPYLPTTESSVAPRQQIEGYVVEAGDTLASIALKFRLQLQTVLLANNLSPRSIIRPGQKLTILPIDGLLHTVRRGERLGTIASAYRVMPEAILSFNRLPNERSLLPGQVLFVPGGRPVPALAPARTQQTVAQVPAAVAVDTGTKLLWPGTGRRITQYFTWRHSGIDIGLPFGTPIYAAESGTVLESRWGGGYGKMVVIKHDNGFITRYGHNSKNLVVPGQRVSRGQTIALVGSTGRSTGPHIHFEVMVRGVRVNPLNYTR